MPPALKLTPEKLAIYDVDIAAWGIAPEDTFRAIGAVMDLETEIPVNLVDIDTCQPLLMKAIKKDGVEL